MQTKQKIKQLLFKNPKYYSLVVLMVGLICSAFMYQSALTKEHNDTYIKYHQRANIHAKDIEAEFKRSFFQVSSVANLFSSSNWVNHSEFDEFVTRVFPNFPQGRRLTSIHRISSKDAEQFIQKMQANPVPDYINYAIYDLTGEDQISPATEVDDHYAVVGYTYPEIKIDNFIGRNVLPESPIGPLIYPVIQTKLPLISDLSGPISGIQEEAFFLYVIPILAKNTEIHVNSNIKGLIVSSQFISSLFVNNLHSKDTAVFNYTLRDKNNNLYQYPEKKLVDPEKYNQTKVKFTFPIQLVNNYFELVISPIDQTLANPDSLLFELFIAGLLLTTSLAFIIHSLLSIHNNLTKEVARQTSALIKQKNQLNKNNLRLAKALEEAKVSEKAKTDFLANMSHEIRTPLNGVIGLTGLLKQTQLNVLQREYTDKLAFSGKHLLSVINDILDFSKIDSGNIILEHKAFSIHSIIDNLNVSLAEQAKAKGLNFSVAIEGDTYPDLMGDAFRINQVLLNLCGNAIKFTESGYVRVAISMIQDIESEHKFFVHFKISDTGVGLEQSEIGSLFKKFSQADTSTTRKFGGTGLGLAISQKLCAAMGGDISVVSSKNKGSVFTATMHLDLNTDVLIKNNSTKQRLLNGDILVVDDNPISLEILTTFIEDIGLNPIAFQSAKEALATLKSDEFDIKVIISDWTMPVMDGASFIKEVGQLSLAKQPKIIIVSAYETAVIENAKGQLPIDYILSKPCHADVLYQAIEECLDDSYLDEPEQKPTNRLLGAHIMVVEDNEINQVVIEHLLVEEGARVTIANHGKEAIDLLNQPNNEFHLILMDIQMPIMDGIQATKIIRSHQDPKIAQLPIVALSANVLENEVSRYLAAGMNAHGAKPVNIESLLLILLPYLDIDD